MKNIKNAIILLTLAAMACTGSSVDKKGEDWLNYQESRVINDIPMAKLTFNSLTDSRCPEGVNCFWAGNAMVGLELSGVSTEGAIRKQVELCLGDCRKAMQPGVHMVDTLETTFAGQPYRIILQEVKRPEKPDSISHAKGYAIKLKVDLL